MKLSNATHRARWLVKAVFRFHLLGSGFIRIMGSRLLLAHLSRRLTANRPSNLASLFHRTLVFRNLGQNIALFVPPIGQLLGSFPRSYSLCIQRMAI